MYILPPFPMDSRFQGWYSSNGLMLGVAKTGRGFVANFTWSGGPNRYTYYIRQERTVMSDKTKRSEEGATSEGGGLKWRKIEVDRDEQNSWDLGGFMGLEVLDGSSAIVERDPESGMSVLRMRSKRTGNDDSSSKGDDLRSKTIRAKGDQKSEKKKKKKMKKRKACVKEIKDEDESETNEKASPTTIITPSQQWKRTRLHPTLLRNLASLSFVRPTTIQERVCIKNVLNGRRDVIGAAETGSGKTLAFGLPILHQLLNGRRKRRSSGIRRLECLVLTPTRELAMQIQKHMTAAAVGSDIEIVNVVGGMAEQKQARLLKRKPEIIVGTPGRLWSLVNKKKEPHLQHLHELRFLVLDEVDRMFDDNAFPELRKLLDRMSSAQIVESDESWLAASKKSEEDDAKGTRRQKRNNRPSLPRQTFLMSATLTMPSWGRRLRKGNRKKMNNFVNWIRKAAGLRPSTLVADCSTIQSIGNVLEDGSGDDSTSASSSLKLPERLEMRQIHCPSEDKDAHLYNFLLQCLSSADRSGCECRILVFANSIAHIKRLTTLLSFLQLPVHSLHAKMQQRQRLKNLDRFKRETRTVLVATDVAARGLDVSNVHYVVHYHLPRTVDVFVHRSGRTARAMQAGLALCLVAPTEIRLYNKICGVLNFSVGIDALPVALDVMRQVHSRVHAAQKLTKLQSEKSKKLSHAQWIEKNAAEMDIVLDDDLQDQIDGLRGNDEDVGHARRLSSKMKGIHQRLLALLGTELRAHHGLLTLFAHIHASSMLTTPSVIAGGEVQRESKKRSIDASDAVIEASACDGDAADAAKVTKVASQKKKKRRQFW